MRVIVLIVALCLTMSAGVFVLTADADVRQQSFAQLDGTPAVETPLFPMSQYGPRLNEWAGQYYAKDNYTILAFERVDPVIDANWGLASPAEGLPKNDFSVAWSGHHEFAAGVYAISVTGTMRMTLAVSGEVVLEQPDTTDATTVTIMHAFEDGVYAIHVRAKDITGKASLNVSWTLIGPLPTATPEASPEATLPGGGTPYGTFETPEPDATP